jgi:hypothetical protein
MTKIILNVIFIDIIAATLLFVVGNVSELGAVMVTFYAMGISGVFAFFLRKSEDTEKTGDFMLYNIFIIPFIFITFIVIGDCWRHYKIYGDDTEYKFDYNTYHFELVLHGDKYNRKNSDNSTEGLNLFDINPIKTRFGIGESGHYEKIGDNTYMLIKQQEHYRNTYYPDGVLCKDTMLLSNDTLYFFFAEPVLVKRKSLFDW